MRCRTPRLFVIATLVAIVASMCAPVAAQDDDPPDAGPEPGAVGEPVAPLENKRLYDVANLLNNGQEATIEMDATRLARHGIPNVIVVRLGAMTPTEAETFAAEIRREWGVESSPGADDGLVMLITITDTEDQRSVATTMSWGDAALPHFGVNEATAADSQHAWLDRYSDQGYLFEGIVFSLRRLIYHSIYDPAPQETLSGTRASLGTAMSVAGVALAAGALALAGWLWTRGRSRGDRDDMAVIALLWGVPAVAAAVFALAVVGRSGWGVTGALVMLGVAAAVWVARDPRRSLETRGAS